WNSNRTAEDSGFQMSWHVIIALIIVNIMRIIFRHNFIEKIFKILSYSRISIFIKYKRSRRMLNKNQTNSFCEFSDLWKGLLNFRSDQMKTSFSFFKPDLLLVNFHNF